MGSEDESIVRSMGVRHERRALNGVLSISSLMTLSLIVLSLMSLTTVRADDSASLPIKHILIVMQENHSLDNYFGTFPGVIRGYTNSTCVFQKDYTGCINPYHLDSNTASGDLCHSWECFHSDYANSTNEGFYETSGKFAFGYYDYRNVPYYWGLARNYTLMDNYFSSVMGPTLPNHLFLVAGQSGGEIGDHQHMQGLNGTYNLKIPSIFAELTNHNVSWTSYSSKSPVNWNAPAFITPVVKNATLYKHVKDPSDFFNDVKSGNLSQVAWIMPARDQSSDHPPYNVQLGERWVRSIVETVQESRYWKSTAILLTWDEGGGWYDMVPPPQVDRFGYGFRVPMIIISPYAKHGFIDHTLADHTSTLAFVERIFNLPPLTERDARASNLMEAFTFSHPRAESPVFSATMSNLLPLFLAVAFLVVVVSVITVHRMKAIAMRSYLNFGGELSLS